MTPWSLNTQKESFQLMIALAQYRKGGVKYKLDFVLTNDFLPPTLMLQSIFHKRHEGVTKKMTMLESFGVDTFFREKERKRDRERERVCV